MGRERQKVFAGRQHKPHSLATTNERLGLMVVVGVAMGADRW